jgi:hypothetical protein
MKLTSKDKDFLETLRTLTDEHALHIDLRNDGLKRLVLRQNYGTRIETAFGMSRQGVRWRFQRVFSDIYVSAFETILLIESAFGTELRHKAMDIARQRVQCRKEAEKTGRIRLPRRQTAPRSADREGLESTRELPS